MSEKARMDDLEHGLAEFIADGRPQQRRYYIEVAGRRGGIQRVRPELADGEIEVEMLGEMRPRVLTLRKASGGEE